MINVRAARDGVRFEVRVQPRASRNEIVGEFNGAVKVRLSAPPVAGVANEALVEFLARALGVARRNVRIVSGTSSRNKTVEVAGADAAAVEGLIG